MQMKHIQLEHAVVRCPIPSGKSQSSHFQVCIPLYYWSVNDNLSNIDATYISALLNSGIDTIWAFEYTRIWCSKWPLEHAYEFWLTRGRMLCMWKDNTSCSVVFTNRSINGTNKRQWNVCSFTDRPYTRCPRRNVPDFGRVFLMLKYTDITQNTLSKVERLRR
jgi:hypothetical protein